MTEELMHLCAVAAEVVHDGAEFRSCWESLRLQSQNDGLIYRAVRAHATQPPHG